MELQTEQNLFLEHLKQQNKSFNTVKNYRTDLNIFNQFLTEKGRSLDLSGIETEELKEYQRYLENKYSSSNSIRRRVQALRLFFDYLITQEKFDHNPIKKIVSSPKNVKLPAPVLFPEIRMVESYLIKRYEQAQDFEKLLSLRNLILIHLIYDGNLKVSQIEKVKMTHLLTKDDNLRVLIVPEKREPFTIPLSKKCLDYIKEYKPLLNAQKDKDQIDFDDLFFNGNPYKILRGGLSARGIEIFFKDLSNKLQMDISARSLRQSCIFKWHNQNVPESTIKERMGVQPQYSLGPFQKMIKDDPAKYIFDEL